jgi:hypothetical protein
VAFAYINLILVEVKKWVKTKKENSKQALLV